MELTGPIAIVAIAMPLAVLVTLIAILHARGRRRRRPDSGRTDVVARYGQRVTATVPEPEPPAKSGSPVTAVRPIEAKPRPEPPLAQVAALSAELLRAEQKGDDRKLAPLYLGLGEARLASGNASEAADLFRKCIRASVKAEDATCHAKARLELGDIARAAGDLTTACEHWQIARGLYFDTRRSSDLEAVEARMQRHGCPTDWVLNDF